MELTDSHCHIQSVGGFEGEEITRALWQKANDTNPDDVIRRALDASVTRMICVGCTLADSELALSFAAKHGECWASVGVHPHETKAFAGDGAGKQRFAELLGAPKVVAVGECGLDYYYEHSDKQSQLAMLQFQIEQALAHDLPLIFHVRDAFDDFWPVFERYHAKDRPVRGVLHSFTDTQSNLDRALEHGLYIGVNGIATFTKNPAQQEVYRAIPLESLLLETDAPFLTPAPYRGKICQPYHVRTTAEFLARERSETLEALARATTNNARTLFGI